MQLTDQNELLKRKKKRKKLGILGKKTHICMSFKFSIMFWWFLLLIYQHLINTLHYSVPKLLLTPIPTTPRAQRLSEKKSEWPPPKVENQKRFVWYAKTKIMAKKKIIYPDQFRALFFFFLLGMNPYRKRFLPVVYSTSTEKHKETELI